LWNLPESRANEPCHIKGDLINRLIKNEYQDNKSGDRGVS
jgi:hypothetical protein